jgi:uroporphyrin-III C-methyltransferase
MTIAKKTARLTVVGAGPGDPDLITLKGVKALRSADIVLYDALANEALLEHVPVHVPRVFVGKRRGHKPLDQDGINRLLVDSARQYGHVVRLKGGDPFVFGRGYEEMDYARRQGIGVDYVPGISSAIAVPGLAGVPVSCRGYSRSFWVMTATNSDGSLSSEVAQAAQNEATVVLLMGLAHIEAIVALFEAAGKSDLPVAVLYHGSRPDAHSVFGTVKDIVQKAQTYTPGMAGIIVLGEVAALGRQLTADGVMSSVLG